MSTIVHQAPPLLNIPVDQEDGGKSFSGLLFLGEHPIAATLLSRLPDGLGDMYQFLKDFSEAITLSRDSSDNDFLAHKVTCGFEMRRIRDFKTKYAEVANAAIRDAGLDPAKLQCMAPWTFHVKHAGGELEGSCLMHVRLLAPYLVGSFDELPVYFDELGSLIQETYRDRPCWDHTWDLQDVTLDLIKRLDPEFAVEIDPETEGR